MATWLAVVICAHALLYGLASVEGAQCTVHTDNPCKATCNGTTFDISTVFNYPLNISGAFGFTYLWDPCKGSVCPSAVKTDGTAVCQKADQFYNCGLLSEPIWLFNYRYEETVFKIQYPWGTDWRFSEFTFVVDKTQKTPSIEFIAEKPLLQYNFLIRGKCIGQPAYDECKYN